MTDERRIFSVSALTKLVRGAIEDRFGHVWVGGEVSNLRRPASGHVYLTLKDENAQLSAVMWRGVASRIRFELVDGLEVIVGGVF